MRAVLKQHDLWAGDSKFYTRSPHRYPLTLNHINSKKNNYQVCSFVVSRVQLYCLHLPLLNLQLIEGGRILICYRSKQTQEDHLQANQSAF